MVLEWGLFCTISLLGSRSCRIISIIIMNVSIDLIKLNGDGKFYKFISQELETNAFACKTGKFIGLVCDEDSIVFE